MGLADELRRGRWLQVALDVTDIRAATLLARISAEEGAAIVEAGTPLIKKHGMASVAEIRNAVGDRAIVLADLKAADAADVEVEMAAEAGAGAVTVLGCAPDPTISAAATEAKRLGVMLFVDMIGVLSPLERIRQVRELGATGIVLHVGIDVQKAEGKTAEALAELAGAAPEDLVIALAGGLNEDSIRRVKGERINVFVVGGAITRSKSPRDAIRRILLAINDP